MLFDRLEVSICFAESSPRSETDQRNGVRLEQKERSAIPGGVRALISVTTPTSLGTHGTAGVALNPRHALI